MISGESKRLAAAVFSAILASSGSVAAQTITLTTLDGSMTLVGELQSFEDGLIVIATSVGEVTIPASLVECQGEGCPDLGPGDDGVAISGDRDLATRLLPPLVLSLADVLDADVEQAPTENGEGVRLDVLDFDGTPLAVVDFRATGAAGGFEDLLASRAAIAVAGRAISDDEAKGFAAKGLGDMRAPGREHVAALDGLEIIVAPGNPAASLTLPQIAGIFSGAIANWSAVGGPDAPIVVHARDEGSDDGAAFREMVLAPNDAALSRDAIRHADDARLEAAVVADPRAIGFVSISSGAPAKTLGLGDACGQIANADAFALKSEEYPLSLRRYLYQNGQPVSSWARDLIDFALSAEAQPAIEAAGYMNQDVVVQPKNQMVGRLALATSDPFIEFDIDRLREFVAIVQNGARMSTTLRLRPGTEELDAKAMKDIARLIDYLATEDLSGREVLLIGFTGPAGRSSRNRTVSLARAKLALETLRELTPDGALSGVEIRALGYGEIAPAVCNSKASGAPANDRIEVWLAKKR